MSRARTHWMLATAAAVAAVVLVAVPVWLIQPFAPQSPRAIAVSWQVRQLAPRVTVALLLPVLASAISLWRLPSPTRLRRVLRGLAVAALVATTGGTTWFARQNHFEWMFRPFPDARFVDAAGATHVAAGAAVLGVTGSGEALAFPITQLGYHHLVNATLGPVPIVATY